MNSVLKFIKSLSINKREYVVVACSCGPDSMCLLSILHELNYKVICAHVNHKLRKESDLEYTFLKDYCEKNDIIFEGIELTGFSTGNFENFARRFRYSFFEKILKQYKSKYLFTAHHGDDLVETVLMRLVRGSSLKGYKGFDLVSERGDYKIIRPLVYLTKEDINKYNEDNKIPFKIDKSNFTDDYTRNRFRHYVLPFLKEEDMLVHERFILFNKVINEADAYIDRVVDMYLSKLLKNNELNIKNFNEIDTFIQNKIIYNILEILYPDNLYLVNNNHIVEILKVINSGKPNITINLPGNILVTKKYNKLIFNSNPDNIGDYDYILEDLIALPTGVIKFVEKEESNSNFVIRLNSNDIKLPLHIRNRKNGDKIFVKNMKGSKKINDIFIDLKIPTEDRNTWPILVDSNNEILWLPGLKKSKFDVTNQGLCDIIITYEKKERNYEQE